MTQEKDNYFIKPNWLFPFGLYRPSTLARLWQEKADNWKSVGEWPRARWCQEHADYWKQPWWRQVFGRKPSNVGPAFRADSSSLPR